MAKYRKKQVVVEAHQLVDGQPWPAGVEYRGKSQLEGESSSLDGHMFVTTIQGERVPVSYGEWIITEPDGVHHYPCAPDVFALNHEPERDVITGSVEISRSRLIAASDKEREALLKFVLANLRDELAHEIAQIAEVAGA